MRGETIGTGAGWLPIYARRRAYHAILPDRLPSRHRVCGEGRLTQLLCLVSSAKLESLPRCAYFKQWQQSARTAKGVCARSNRPNRLSNPIALGVLQRFAKFPPVCDLRAGGIKRLERCLQFSGPRADAQRESRTVDSPVVRVQVRIEDLQSGARF